MSPNFHRDVAITDETQVGVVALLLRNSADAAEEIQRHDEILDAPFATDAPAVVSQAPGGHGGEVSWKVCGRHGRGSAFTGLTALFCERGGVCGHTCFLSKGRVVGAVS